MSAPNVPLNPEPSQAVLAGKEECGVIVVQGLWASLVLAVAGLVAAATPTSVERVEGNLHLAASIPRASYAVGERVETIVTARNAGEGPLAITFSSGQGYDLLIRRPRGDEIWRWSNDKAFTQIVQTTTLKAGASVSFRGAWDQRDLQGRRVDPGTYEVVAIFMGHLEGGDKRPVQLPPITFVIHL